MIPKLRVELSLKDLSPIEELENDFREALNQCTRPEKSDAVYRAFEHWLVLRNREFNLYLIDFLRGDVIPLVGAFDRLMLKLRKRVCISRYSTLEYR
jgi:hypothetical protein